MTRAQSCRIGDSAEAPHRPSRFAISREKRYARVGEVCIRENRARGGGARGAGGGTLVEIMKYAEFISARYGARAAINKNSVTRRSGCERTRARARVRFLHTSTPCRVSLAALRNAESSKNVFMTCGDTVIGVHRREYDYY